MKGLFITFEGCEGSGKTTILDKVYEELLKMGKKVIKTREPGGSIISEQIRNVILNVNNTMMDARCEALLYAASRRQHLMEVVVPKLNEGYIVLCDRYLDSSLAYQGVARGIGFEEVLSINSFAINGLLPDKTIFLDVRPEVGLERIKLNNRETNRLDKEKLSFHNLVYSGYMRIKEEFPERFIAIDGEREIEEVFLSTIQEIKKLL